MLCVLEIKGSWLYLFLCLVTVNNIQENTNIIITFYMVVLRHHLVHTRVSLSSYLFLVGKVESLLAPRHPAVKGRDSLRYQHVSTHALKSGELQCWHCVGCVRAGEELHMSACSADPLSLSGNRWQQCIGHPGWLTQIGNGHPVFPCRTE